MSARLVTPGPVWQARQRALQAEAALLLRFCMAARIEGRWAGLRGYQLDLVRVRQQAEHTRRALAARVAA